MMLLRWNEKACSSGFLVLLAGGLSDDIDVMSLTGLFMIGKRACSIRNHLNDPLNICPALLKPHPDQSVLAAGSSHLKEHISF